jgi:hypothetical protein
MGGFDALYAKAVANSKAEEERRKPKVTTTERDSNGNKVTVTKDAPTKKEFYAEVARRQVATGQGIGGKDNLKYTQTSEGYRIANAAEKQGLHVGNVRKESIKKAEIQNQARNELLAEKSKANGPLTAGQRNPDGSRVTSVRGQRPNEPTQAQIDQKAAEIAQRGGVNKHVVDDLVAKANAQASQSQDVIQGTTVVGRPPAGYEQLNEQQKNTYNNLKSGSPATAEYFLNQATAPKPEEIKASRGALGPSLQSELLQIEASNPGYKYANSFTVDPNTGVVSFSLYNVEQAKQYHDEFFQYKRDQFEARQANAKIVADTKSDNQKLRDIADRSGYALNQSVQVNEDGTKSTTNEFIVKPQVPDSERYGVEWVDATGKSETQVKMERLAVKNQANAEGYVINETRLSNGSYVIEKIPKTPEKRTTEERLKTLLVDLPVNKGIDLLTGVGSLFGYLPVSQEQKSQGEANLQAFGKNARKTLGVKEVPDYGVASILVSGAEAGLGDMEAQQRLVKTKKEISTNPEALANAIFSSSLDIASLGGPATIKAGVTGVKEGLIVGAKFVTKSGEKEAVKSVEQAGKLSGTVGAEGLKNPEIIKLGTSGQPLKNIVGIPFEEKAISVGGKTIKVSVPAKTKLYEVVENVGKEKGLVRNEFGPYKKLTGEDVAGTKETAGFFNPTSGDITVARQTTSVEEKLLSVGQSPGYGSKAVEGAIESGKPAIQPTIPLTEGEVGKVRNLSGGNYAKSNTTYVESNKPRIRNTQKKVAPTTEDIALGVAKPEEVPFGTRGFGKNDQFSLTSDVQQSRINRSVPQNSKAEYIRGQSVEQSIPYIPKITSKTQAAEYTRYIEESPELRIKIQKQERLMGSAKKDLDAVNKEIESTEAEINSLDSQMSLQLDAGSEGAAQVNNARQRLVALQTKKQELENKISNARAKAPITREDVLGAIQRGQTKARDVEGKDISFFHEKYINKKIAAPGLIVQPERFAQKFEVLTYEKAALNKAARDEIQASSKSMQSADLQKKLLGDQKTVKRISKVGKSEDILKEPTFDQPLEQNLSFSRNKSLLEEKPATSKRAASEESRAKSIEELRQPVVEGKGFKLIGPQSARSIGTLGLYGATGSSKKVRVEEETNYVRYPGEKLEPKMLTNTKLELITKPGSGQGFQGNFKVPSDLKTVPGFGNDTKTVPGTTPKQGHGLITVPTTVPTFDIGTTHDGGTIRVPRIDVPTVPKIPGPKEIPVPTLKVPEIIFPGGGGGLKVGHGSGNYDSAVGLKEHDVANILYPALSIGKSIPKLKLDDLFKTPKKGKKKGGSIF